MLRVHSWTILSEWTATKAIPSPHSSKTPSISSRDKLHVCSACKWAIERDFSGTPRNPGSWGLRLTELQLPLYAMSVLGNIIFTRLHHPRRTSVHFIGHTCLKVSFKLRSQLHGLFSIWSQYQISALGNLLEAAWKTLLAA